MTSLKDARILYVEDDLTNRMVVAANLKSTGVDLRYGRTGEIPIVTTYLAAVMPIDLVLLDLMLPNNLSGYDIFDALRRDDRFKDIPVVILSASEPEVEIPKAKARGLNGFIGKPINPDKFADQIAECLAGNQVWYAHQDDLELF